MNYSASTYSTLIWFITAAISAMDEIKKYTQITSISYEKVEAQSKNTSPDLGWESFGQNSFV